MDHCVIGVLISPNPAQGIQCGFARQADSDSSSMRACSGWRRRWNDRWGGSWPATEYFLHAEVKSGLRKGTDDEADQVHLKGLLGISMLRAQNRTDIRAVW